MPAQMNTAITVPPKQDQNHKWHWLCKEGSDELLMAEWIDSEWFITGRALGLVPEEMHRRKWRWLAIAVPPKK